MRPIVSASHTRYPRECNRPKIPPIIHRSGFKKYDDALYQVWATLLQWGETKDMYTPPKEHRKWQAVEQALAAEREGVRVPPSNSGRGGGAAGFKTAFMPGGGAAAGFGAAGTFGAGAFGSFAATPNAFGAGAFPYQQTYAPHTAFFPQMQQHVPPGYQQMHPQQQPFEVSRR